MRLFGTFESLIALSCILGVLLTWVARGYALKTRLQDSPNERSLHSIPTPRGGGLSIVAIGLAGLFSITGASTWVLGASLIALVGWIDDRRGLSAKARLVVHFVGAGLFVYWLGRQPSGFSHLSPILDWLPSWATALAMTLWIAWSINFYNFMDGSDGICASHAASALLAAALLADSRSGFSLHALAIGSCLGFLFWNWPKAKIFLGDVGSGFLGFMVGAFTFQSGELKWPTLLLLNSPFIADSTFTLIRRGLSGRKVTQAHREHAYQKCVLQGWSHTRVALLYNGMIWLVCFPLAKMSRDSMPLTLGAFLCVSALISGWAYSRGAGLPEKI